MSQEIVIRDIFNRGGGSLDFGKTAFNTRCLG